MGKIVSNISEDALTAMMAYSWPGNVRELRNAIERSLLTCKGDTIEKQDLPDKIRSLQPDIASIQPEQEVPTDVGLDEWLAETEKKIILQALEECNGVQACAARRLKISERSLWHRVKKFDIQVNKKVSE